MKEYPILHYQSDSTVPNTSKSIFLTFTLYAIFGLSWAKGSMACRPPGDTVVVEASTKTIKHKNRGRNIGKASFWDTGTDRRFEVTPFFGPPGYQIQKIGIPIRCECSEIDSFEVILLYTDLSSCKTQTIYSGWQVLEGKKQLTFIPERSVTTDSIYLLSIHLRPNRYPANHLEDLRSYRYACFYLKLGPIESGLGYYYSDSTGMLSYPRPPHTDDWGFILAPKMKLWLYR